MKISNNIILNFGIRFFNNDCVQIDPALIIICLKTSQHFTLTSPKIRGGVEILLLTLILFISAFRIQHCFKI